MKMFHPQAHGGEKKPNPPFSSPPRLKNEAVFDTGWKAWHFAQPRAFDKSPIFPGTQLCAAVPSRDGRGENPRPLPASLAPGHRSQRLPPPVPAERRGGGTDKPTPRLRRHPRLKHRGEIKGKK